MKLSELPNINSFKLNKAEFCLRGSFHISSLARGCLAIMRLQPMCARLWFPHKQPLPSNGVGSARAPPLHGLGPQAQVPADSWEGLWAGRKSVQSSPTRFRRILDRFQCTSTTTSSASGLPSSPLACFSPTWTKTRRQHPQQQGDDTHTY